MGCPWSAMMVLSWRSRSGGDTWRGFPAEYGGEAAQQWGRSFQRGEDTVLQSEPTEQETRWTVKEADVKPLQENEHKDKEIKQARHTLKAASVCSWIYCTKRSFG